MLKRMLFISEYYFSSNHCYTSNTPCKVLVYLFTTTNQATKSSGIDVIPLNGHAFDVSRFVRLTQL